MTRSRQSPFGMHLGFEITEMASGHAKVVFDAAEEHQNSAGIVHGGVTSSIIDHAAGAAILSSEIGAGRYPLTTKLEVEFLLPIERGRVECEASVDTWEGDAVLVTATVASAGQVRARGRVQFLLRKRLA